MAPTHHHHHHHHHHKCCQIKQKLRRGLWSPQEDEKLMNHIKTYGPCSWSSVPQLAGLERCGKSCRLRWINYLRPNLKRGSFSPIEEQRIIELHSILGNKWSKIASFFPGRTDNEIKNLWNSSLKKRLESRSLKKQIGKEAANHTEITNHSYNDQSHHANDANQGSLITSPSPNHPPLKPIKSILHTPADPNAVKINPSLINFPFALQPNDHYYSPPIHSHAVFNHLLNPAPNHAQAAANHVADGANELLIATDQASPPLITSLQAMAADHSHIIPNNNNTNDHVNDKWLMSSKHCYDNYPPLMDHSNNNHNNNNNNTNNYAMGKEGGSLMTWVYVNQAQLSLIRELNHHINQQSGSLIPFQEEDGYSPLIMGDDRVVSGGGGGRQGLWPGPGPGPGTARDCHAGSSGQSPTSTCTTAMGGGGDTSSSLPSLLDNCSEDDVNLWFGEQDEEEEELVGDILSFPHYS